MPDRIARRGAAVLWRDPPILAIVSFCVLTGVWHLVGWGGDRSRMLGLSLSQPVLSVVYFVLTRRVARLPGLPAPTRRLWTGCSIGALCYGVGELVQIFLDLGAPVAIPSYSGIAHEIGLVVGISFPILAMLTLPIPNGSRREQLRFWLDASTVMAGAAVFAWYFSLSGSVGSDSPGDLVGPVLIAGVELVAAFAVVKVLLTGAAGFVPEAAFCGAVGIGLQGVVAGVIPLVAGTAWLPVLVALEMLPGAMVVAAPRIQELRVRADSALLNPTPRRPYSLMPYLAVAATLVLLVIVLADLGLGSAVWGVLIGVVASTSLVVARQLAALSENASLLAQLETSFRELRRQEQLLRHQASHDHLTQLANRVLFTERARLTTGGTGDPTAVIMIDLDDFKPINDNLGHHVGDAVLVAVADRLRACVRPGDTVARLGGDEFAVLLPTATDADARSVVERITSALTEPLHAEGNVLRVHASIGLAAGVSDDLEALLRDADDAMYAAKRKGTDRRAQDEARSTAHRL